MKLLSWWWMSLLRCLGKWTDNSWNINELLSWKYFVPLHSKGVCIEYLLAIPTARHSFSRTFTRTTVLALDAMSYSQIRTTPFEFILLLQSFQMIYICVNTHIYTYLCRRVPKILYMLYAIIYGLRETPFQAQILCLIPQETDNTLWTWPWGYTWASYPL